MAGRLAFRAGSPRPTAGDGRAANGLARASGMVEGKRQPLILRRIQSYEPDWRSPDDYTVHVDGGDQSVGRIFRRYAAHPEG